MRTPAQEGISTPVKLYGPTVNVFPVRAQFCIKSVTSTVWQDDAISLVAGPYVALSTCTVPAPWHPKVRELPSWMVLEDIDPFGPSWIQIA
jgi:hypothetical protein